VGFAFGVGREAPTFIMKAVDGSEINLKQYRGDWFPVLIFVPSAGDAAAGVLEQLGTVAGKLWGLRGQILAFCVASPDEAAALAAASPNGVPLVPDDGAVARAYGALKDDGTVRPMTYIVDRAGKIVWAGEGRQAHEPAALLAAFRQVAR
jgi:peroxiredoxin